MNFSKCKKVCNNLWHIHCMFPEWWNTAKVLTMFFISTWLYLYKKFNFYDGFLSHLLNSTANPAHLAATFCPFLVCPQVNMINNDKCISSKRALSHQDSWTPLGFPFFRHPFLTLLTKTRRWRSPLHGGKFSQIFLLKGRIINLTLFRWNTFEHTLVHFKLKWPIFTETLFFELCKKICWSQWQW